MNDDFLSQLEADNRRRTRRAIRRARWGTVVLWVGGVLIFAVVIGSIAWDHMQ